MSDLPRWSIPEVRDALERTGDKTLEVSLGVREVIFRTPPGDVARLGAVQLTNLINVLREARLELFRQEQS